MKIFKIFARKRSDSYSENDPDSAFDSGQCEAICKTTAERCMNSSGKKRGVNNSKFCALHYNGGKKKPIKDNEEVNLKGMKQLIEEMNALNDICWETCKNGTPCGKKKWTL